MTEELDAKFYMMQESFWIHSRDKPQKDFVEYVIKYAP